MSLQAPEELEQESINPSGSPCEGGFHSVVSGRSVTEQILL